MGVPRMLDSILPRRLPQWLQGDKPHSEPVEFVNSQFLLSKIQSLLTTHSPKFIS